MKKKKAGIFLRSTRTIGFFILLGASHILLIVPDFPLGILCQVLNLAHQRRKFRWQKAGPDGLNLIVHQINHAAQVTQVHLAAFGQHLGLQSPIHFLSPLSIVLVYVFEPPLAIRQIAAYHLLYGE
jgi:hypothetical protein